MKKVYLIILLLFFAITNIVYGQSEEVTQSEINQIFNYYRNFDSKLLDQIGNNFSFNDFTIGIKYNSKEPLAKILASSQKNIHNYKIDIESYYYISPTVIDVHGKLSGSVKEESFSSRFSTILIFDKEKKIISWSDHVDPKTFKGNSSVSEKQRKFIEDFFKVYERLDTTELDKYLHPNVKLIDPTLKLESQGLTAIKDIWLQAKDLYHSGHFELKSIYFITEDVIDIHGTIEGTTKKGKNISTPFSTIFILEDGKIKHWTDHVDKEALK